MLKTNLFWIKTYRGHTSRALCFNVIKCGVYCGGFTPEWFKSLNLSFFSFCHARSRSSDTQSVIIRGKLLIFVSHSHCRRSACAPAFNWEFANEARWIWAPLSAAVDPLVLLAVRAEPCRVDSHRLEVNFLIQLSKLCFYLWVSRLLRLWHCQKWAWRRTPRFIFCFTLVWYIVHLQLFQQRRLHCVPSRVLLMNLTLCATVLSSFF